ncbi:hypothetical protein [Brevundimonas sp.]|uniref:hypothetical protein n=1 Tax=Brevundimonas sp. TaxID=1871086 RepID=UPI003D0E8B99
MTDIERDLPTLVESNEHLIKAIIALLSLRDPHFLKDLDQVFTVATLHDSPIAHMRDEAWSEVFRELKIVAEFLHGAGLPATSAETITKAH